MKPRPAFTLFEVILAIALSVTLLGLIGTAINLYLTRVDASRSRVEEAQLARSILATIADDIRGAAIYQPQDTSGIAKLMAAGTTFDVDSIDKARQSSSSSTSSTGTSSSATALSSATSSSGTSSSSTGGANSEPEDTMPLGLSGKINELYVDVSRLPRQEELFSTVTGYQNAQLPNAKGGAAVSAVSATAGTVPPADIKSVHYCIRAGEAAEPGSASATSLDLAGQQRVSGLVRQEIPRTQRVFAEVSGNSAILESNQTVLAPEVVQIAFRYYDGSEVTDDWDMEEKKKLPVAIEVRLWLTSPNVASTSIASLGGPNSLAADVREYRQTVYLPMSQMSEAAAGGAMDQSSNSSSSSSSTGASTGSSSSGGNGSSFDQ